MKFPISSVTCKDFIVSLLLLEFWVERNFLNLILYTSVFLIIQYWCYAKK